MSVYRVKSAADLPKNVRIAGIAHVDSKGKVSAFQKTDIPLKPSKYKNVKTEVDGIKFDSKKEALLFSGLKLSEMVGDITGLERQVKYELIPSQTRSDGSKERAVNYIADFQYRKRNGVLVVADAKGIKTPDYIIKRKLMLHVHGITILEV
jgi:hypothetical protein